MKIHVNGKIIEMTADDTVADLVQHLCGNNTQGVAVAQNGQIVRRSQWTQTKLHEGDELEVLHATSGG